MRKPFWQRLLIAAEDVMQFCYKVIVVVGVIAQAIIAIIGIYEIIRFF